MDKIIKRLFEKSEIQDPVISINDKLYNKNLQSFLDREEDETLKEATLITDHLIYWIELYLNNDEELYDLSKQFRDKEGECCPEFITMVYIELLKHRQKTHFGMYKVIK